MPASFDDTTCPIFGIPAKGRLLAGQDPHIVCPRAGGEYQITDTARAVIANWEDDVKIKLARWIYEQNQLGEVPTINSDASKYLEPRRKLTVAQRAEALFRMIAQEQRSAGELIRYVVAGCVVSEMAYKAIAATESTLENSEHFPDKSRELEYLFNYLCKDGRLQEIKDGTYNISPYGHSVLDGTAVVNSNQAFVAMWFGDDVKDAYTKGIEPAIRDARYVPMRIDNKETNNKIDDEIIAEIRKSKFLIADFTSGFIKDANVSEEEALKGIPQRKLLARGGVYYEAGFAQGLGLPVIWTCRADCIEKVHFDTRQYNHIVWESVEELYEKLKHRIEATII